MSTAVSAIGPPPASSNAPVLPPGAAQASSTRSPADTCQQAGGQLRAGILDRHQALGEPGQLGHGARRIEHHRAGHPGDHACCKPLLLQHVQIGFTGDPRQIDAQRHRRMRIVGGDDLLPAASDTAL